VSIWFMVILSAVSAIDYFAAFHLTGFRSRQFRRRIM